MDGMESGRFLGRKHIGCLELWKVKMVPAGSIPMPEEIPADSTAGRMIKVMGILLAAHREKLIEWSSRDCVQREEILSWAEELHDRFDDLTRGSGLEWLIQPWESN